MFVMYAYHRTSKVLAIFLLTFVCLNAGGAACLAYCENFEIADADHCPLARKADHCNLTIQTAEKTEAINGLSLDCCRLPLSIISAPLASAELKERDAQPERIEETERRRFVAAYQFRFVSVSHYRPPPKHGSRLCIRNCALLI